MERWLTNTSKIQSTKSDVQASLQLRKRRTEEEMPSRLSSDFGGR